MVQAFPIKMRSAIQHKEPWRDWTKTYKLLSTGCHSIFDTFWSVSIYAYTKIVLPSGEKMQGGLVEKVVGRNFDASVLNSAENVFLEVCVIELIDVTC